MICIWFSRCHCHPVISCFSKIQNGLSFWYRPTQVVLEKRPLNGCVCDDWRKGVILPFYKGKGSRQDCRNYRGITLLSVPGKVFAHVLLSWIRERLRSHRRVQQSGFTPHRSTIDGIITLQLLLQTRREYCRPLWITYVI